MGPKSPSSFWTASEATHGNINVVIAVKTKPVAHVA